MCRHVSFQLLTGWTLTYAGYAAISYVPLDLLLHFFPWFQTSFQIRLGFCHCAELTSKALGYDTCWSVLRSIHHARGVPVHLQFSGWPVVIGWADEWTSIYRFWRALDPENSLTAMESACQMINCYDACVHHTLRRRARTDACIRGLTCFCKLDKPSQ